MRVYEWGDLPNDPVQIHQNGILNIQQRTPEERVLGEGAKAVRQQNNEFNQFFGH